MMNGCDEVLMERSFYLRINAIIEKLLLKRGGDKHHFTQFLSELPSLRIVEDGSLPDDVVRLQSFVRYRYTESDEQHESVLVLPADTVPDKSSLSILSPLGLAMIGRRCSSVFEYSAPGGIYRIQIDDVLHRPQV